MKRTRRKILSVFLSLCMIISCMVGMSVTAGAVVSPSVSKATSNLSGNGNVTADNFYQDFVEVSEEEAKAWTGAPAGNTSILLYKIDGSTLFQVIFVNGNYTDSTSTNMTISDWNMTYGNIDVYYTTGSGSSTPSETETLLTTITATAKEQASYSTANVATVSFSYTAGGSSAYLANWGWWGYGWTATVTPVEGYTITKCVFYDDANRKATDSKAPFVVETTEEDKTPRINGTPIDGGNMQSKGITKIEVYGYVTPATVAKPTVTISPEGAGTASVDEDPANSDNWLFTATPKEGYKFKWWALDHSNAPTGKYLKNTTSIVKTNFTESAGNNMITGITAVFEEDSTPSTPAWTNGNVTATLNGTKLTVEKTAGAADGTMGTSWTKVGSAPTWSTIKETITEVEIKDGVTSIGNSAFLYCSKLASVTIPSSVTSIGISSFFGCSALTSVTIPSSVTSIGNAAFYYCTALTSVTIPNSVMSIGENTFNGCSNLTSVTFTPGTADATLTIGANAFKDTKSGATVAYGTGNTVLYDNDTQITTETLLTAIQDKTLTWKASSSAPSWTNGNVTATLNGTKLTVEKTAGAADGTMGTSWTKVGSAPTWSTIKETITEVEIKDGVTSIGANAFNRCSNLTSVTFPSGLTSIGDAVFANCSALTSVTFPSSLNSIGQRAFHVCTVLASVTFTPGQEGAGLTIGDSAFDDIPSTTKVTYGTGNTVLYDDTTEITTDTLLTAIQRKSLTWKAASSTPATTTAGFVKVTDASQITEDNIAETTTADAKAWIKANLTTLKSELGTWYDFFWKENGTLKVIVLNYLALDETHVNEETVYDPEFDDASQFFNKNENVYFWGGSSTPATTDVSFVRAASAEELQTNLPNIPTYTKEQAEAWIAANKATLAPAYAAQKQAHGDALFVVVYAISEHMYSVLVSGKSDLSNFQVDYYSLGNLKSNFTEYYDMVYYPEVTAATHTHTWGYNADGATITANCTGTGDCDITEGLTLTISAPASTSLTYDGTAKEASLSTGYNTTAFPGTYTIEYYNGTTKLGSAPVNAGTYTAKVTAGTGDGAATASVDFTITPKTVSSPTITLSPESFTYDGTAKQPTVTVKDGTTEISSDEYIVTYSNNTNAGTATVTITDKDGGNYTVSGEKTFTISPKEVNNPTITLSPESFTYDSTAKQPTVTVKDGTTVISAEEYNVEYSNNTNAGTATVTITDKTGGNYTVSGEKTFTIAPASQSAPAVSSTDETIAGKADGTITNVTTAMEYKLSTATVYTPITGTSVTGLAAGTYNVRYAEKANYNASPATNVVIGAGNKITVTFDADGGTPAPASQQFNYNQTVSKPATDPTKTGYTFKFWSADGTAEYAFNTPLTANITLTAVYQVNSYTITFDTDGGSAIAAITQDYNTAVTAPADPIKTGYTFAGWEPAIPETMPAEDITVKAKWTINQYTITFNTLGGSAIAPITQNYGTRITRPSDPTRDGYEFIGWNPDIPPMMPAENMTITASWKKASTIPGYVPSSVTPTPITNNVPTYTMPDVSGLDITGKQDELNQNDLSWNTVPGAIGYSLSIKMNGKYVYIQDLGNTTNVDVVLGTNGRYYVSTGGDYNIYEYDETTETFIRVGTLNASKIGNIVKANNVTNDFMVKIKDQNGNETTENNSYKVSVKVYYKPVLRLFTARKNGKSSITIKWDKVQGATKYRVYKYTGKGLKLITETTGRSVKINGTKSGVKYTYAVKAFVNGKWTKVYPSDLASIVSK